VRPILPSQPTSPHANSSCLLPLVPPPSSETSHWWTEGGDDLASVVADAAVGGEENPWGDLGDGLQAKEPLGVL
jgi:hypothetical protein